MTERALRLADQRGRDRLTAAREAGSTSPPHPDDRSAAPLGRACRRKGQLVPTQGRVPREAHGLHMICHICVTEASQHRHESPRRRAACRSARALPAARGPIGREALPAAPVGLRGPCRPHGGSPLPVRTAVAQCPKQWAHSLEVARRTAGHNRWQACLDPLGLTGDWASGQSIPWRCLEQTPGRPGVQAVQVRRVMSR